MRSAPSVVAATTGSASRETRRVLMRQLRRAIRDGAGRALGRLDRRRAAADAPAGQRRRRRALGAAGRRPAAVRGFWARWGEEPRSVPPCGSGSAAALLSLLKRPCTSVATSGPGVPRVNGGTVSGRGGAESPPGGRE